jgi:hypothetical protein
VVHASAQPSTASVDPKQSHSYQNGNCEHTPSQYVQLARCSRPQAVHASLNPQILSLVCMAVSIEDGKEKTKSQRTRRTVHLQCMIACQRLMQNSAAMGLSSKPKLPTNSSSLCSCGKGRQLLTGFNGRLSAAELGGRGGHIIYWRRRVNGRHGREGCHVGVRLSETNTSHKCK